MSFEHILIENNNSISTITINREDKLNALNKNMIQEIGVAVEQAESNPEIRVIIITGAGKKAFIAGADIAEFSSYSDTEAKELSASGHRVFNAIENCRKPVIAAINGFALGGGCELAMACHIRLASDTARFGQPEVKLGLIPGYGGTQRLSMLVGKGKALELLLSGDMMNATDALQWKLINAVYPLDDLITKTIEFATKLTLMAPLAMQEIIHCVNAPSLQEGLTQEIEAFGRCFTTEDMKEGVNAFMQKRAANFNGK